MKSIVLFTLVCCFHVHVAAQSKWMFENYNYFQQPGSATFVPIIQLETANNWYGEVRYNYEDNNTISFLGGRTINGGKALSYTLTPMIGISAGQLTGITAAINADLEWNKLYMSVESQYSKSLSGKSSDFFFNWSEIGYSITDHVFAGVALQYTKEAEGTYAEPGILAGFSYKNVSVPFYAFSPFSPSKYFVLGINVEYSYRKKKRQSTL